MTKTVSLTNVKKHVVFYSILKYGYMTSKWSTYIYYSYLLASKMNVARLFFLLNFIVFNILQILTFTFNFVSSINWTKGAKDIL